MNVIFKVGLSGFFFFLTGCSIQTDISQIDSNGVIHWSSGVKENVHVSTSNEHLVFVSSSLMKREMVIYSRVIGGSTPECEYYVNGPMPHVRLTLCGDGNIELLNRGKTINVGQLTVFES